MTHRKRGRPTRRLKHLPEAVTYAREQAGLTKRALAEAVGISEQLMNDIESGWRSATDDTLNKLAAALHCPRVVLEARHEMAATSGAVVSPS